MAFRTAPAPGGRYREAIDLGAIVDGFHGGSAIRGAGGDDQRGGARALLYHRIVPCGRIAQAVVGNRVGDISHAIHATRGARLFRGAGARWPRNRPEYARGAPGAQLWASGPRAGADAGSMTLAIEPMVNLGRPRWKVAPTNGRCRHRTERCLRISAHHRRHPGWPDGPL